MQAIFLLLLIFTIAGLISRLGHATLFSRFLIAPTFITIGYAVSQNGLGFLRISTIERLDIFIQASIVWLAFLLGLRRLALARARVYQKISARLFQNSMTFLFTFLVTVPVIYFFSSGRFLDANNTTLLVAFSFLTSCLLIGREAILANAIRINNYQAAIYGVLGLLLFHSYINLKNSLTLYDALAPIFAALVAAAICTLILKLIFMSEVAKDDIVVLILLALCFLLAGSSVSFKTPHVLAGFFFGYFASFIRDPLGNISRDLFLSEQPVRIVLMILIGAQLQFYWEPVLLGLKLGLSIYIMRYFAHNFFSRFNKSKRFFSSFMGTSEICILFAASMWFSLPRWHAELNSFVLFILCAGSVGDIFGVIRWSWLLRLRKQNALGFDEQGD